MDSHYRSVAKAISWRVLAAIITAFVAWGITGKIQFALAISTADSLIKLLFFYLHERTWNRMDFGRLRPREFPREGG